MGLSAGRSPNNVKEVASPLRIVVPQGCGRQKAEALAPNGVPSADLPQASRPASDVWRRLSQQCHARLSE
jgi:hypothetical protein